MGAADVEDVIVVSTKDATLVAKRCNGGIVKEVVQELAANQRNEAERSTISPFTARGGITRPCI